MISFRSLFMVGLVASFVLKASAFAHQEDVPSLAAGSLSQSSAQGSIPGSLRGLMNPDISLDGLFSLAQFNRDFPVSWIESHDPSVNGFSIDQLELTMSSNVDPYFRADTHIIIVPGRIEIEEAYGTTLDLPGNFQIKAGQFFTAFGRQNPTHPHSWDFANKPLVLGRFFGGDGLRNPGVQLSWLTPLPWFSEITASQQNSTGETAARFQPGGEMRAVADGVSLLRWNNFVPVTDEFLINTGVSYLSGLNREGGGARTQLLGADVQFRYRGLASLSFIALEIEAIRRIYGLSDGGDALKDWGAYAELKYRLPFAGARWHVGVRYDLVGDKAAPVITATEGRLEPDSPGAIDTDFSRRYRISPVVTFYPSEFSKLRLQYDYDRPSDLDRPQHAAILQFEFVIGSHGAHKF